VVIIISQFLSQCRQRSAQGLIQACLDHVPRFAFQQMSYAAGQG
jgi:hypothetical protein